MHILRGGHISLMAYLTLQPCEHCRWAAALCGASALRERVRQASIQRGARGGAGTRASPHPVRYSVRCGVTCGVTH
jgi:hypothetical protein